ncbi:hypothetical protein HMPREF0731_4302, partial [Pseudoroseomonas cervicalis ATCC 49957]
AQQLGAAGVVPQQAEQALRLPGWQRGSLGGGGGAIGGGGLGESRQAPAQHQQQEGQEAHGAQRKPSRPRMVKPLFCNAASPAPCRPVQKMKQWPSCRPPAPRPACGAAKPR